MIQNQPCKGFKTNRPFKKVAGDNRSRTDPIRCAVLGGSGPTDTTRGCTSHGTVGGSGRQPPLEDKDTISNCVCQNTHGSPKRDFGIRTQVYYKLDPGEIPADLFE